MGDDPFNPDFISLVLDDDVVACGETVSGVFSWSSDRQMRKARVVLRYKTEGRGDTNREDVTVTDFEPSPSGQHRFHLRVPHDGPPTYVGDLITLRWSVRGYLDLPGRKDARSEQSIDVVPRGRQPLHDQ